MTQNKAVGIVTMLLAERLRNRVWIPCRDKHIPFVSKVPRPALRPIQPLIPIVKGALAQVEKGPHVHLTTYLHLNPKLGMSGAIPQYPMYLRNLQRDNFNFFFMFIMSKSLSCCLIEKRLDYPLQYFHFQKGNLLRSSSNVMKIVFWYFPKNTPFCVFICLLKYIQLYIARVLLMFWLPDTHTKRDMPFCLRAAWSILGRFAFKSLPETCHCASAFFVCYQLTGVKVWGQ
jgi:hypothetical protein